MSNSNNGGSGSAGNVLAIIGAVVFIIWAISSLSSSGGESASSKYERNFKSGIEKYNSGQEMNRDEYNAVKDFKKWQSKNSEKTYSDWDE